MNSDTASYLRYSTGVCRPSRCDAAALPEPGGLIAATSAVPVFTSPATVAASAG